MSSRSTVSTVNGIILFAHGSRDPQWHQPMQQVDERIRQLDPHVQVRCAYLELTAPDLPTCANELIRTGIRSITIIPMFLGVGRHAREDLPNLLAELRVAHPTVGFRLQPAIGEDARVLDLLARIAMDGGL